MDNLPNLSLEEHINYLLLFTIYCYYLLLICTYLCIKDISFSLTKLWSLTILLFSKNIACIYCWRNYFTSTNSVPTDFVSTSTVIYLQSIEITTTSLQTFIEENKCFRFIRIKPIVWE